MLEWFEDNEWWRTGPSEQYKKTINMPVMSPEEKERLFQAILKSICKNDKKEKKTEYLPEDLFEI